MPQKYVNILNIVIFYLDFEGNEQYHYFCRKLK